MTDPSRCCEPGEPCQVCREDPVKLIDDLHEQVLPFGAWSSLRDELHTELDRFMLVLAEPTTERTRYDWQLQLAVGLSNAMYRAYQTDDDDDVPD